MHGLLFILMKHLPESECFFFGVATLLHCLFSPYRNIMRREILALCILREDIFVLFATGAAARSQQWAHSPALARSRARFANLNFELKQQYNLEQPEGLDKEME